MKVKTMLGKEVDVTQLMVQNETAIAIGNLNMNARGDILGPGGKILKRKEQVAQEYHKHNPNAVKQVSLKEVAADTFVSPSIAPAETFLSPAEAVEQALAAQKTTSKKKIIDSDE